MTDPSRQHTEIPFGEEVPEELHPLLQSLVDNLKPIVIGIAVILLIVGAYALWGHVQASNIAEAREELGRIRAEKPGAEQVKALQALLADAPSDLATAVRLELAKAQTDAGMDKEAAATWAELAKAPDLAALAGLGRAASLSRAGEHEAALGVLRDLRGSAPEAYATQIARMTATEAEAAGDLQTALAAYREIKDKGAARNQSYLDHKIARLTEALEGQAKAEPAS